MKKEVTLTDIDATLTGVQELLMHVVEHMATKEETADGLTAIHEEMATKKEMTEGFAAIHEEMATKTEMSAGFASVRSEISEVKQQLKDLEEVVQDQAGFAKEIDHNLARTLAIERHLGLAVS